MTTEEVNQKKQVAEQAKHEAWQANEHRHREQFYEADGITRKNVRDGATQATREQARSYDTSVPTPNTKKVEQLVAAG